MPCKVAVWWHPAPTVPQDSPPLGCPGPTLSCPALVMILGCLSWKSWEEAWAQVVTSPQALHLW